MAYRIDPDLSFLAQCSSEELDPLVKYLTQDKDGALRYTEELTMSAEYKAFAPNHRRYWQLVAAELQLFGGNSFVSLFRGGEGVLYREVLTDVCDKMKVNYNKKATTEFIESSLMAKILTDALENMSEKERRELVQAIGVKTTSFTGPAVAAAIQIAIRTSGFMAYQIAATVANIVARQLLGHGLTFAANAALTRVIGILAGPIGWALTGLWTALTIAGPAYRVTIPSVIHVAFLRASLKHRGSGT